SRELDALEGDAAEGLYGITTIDLCLPFRRVEWTADGVIENPTTQSTNITFDVAGARVGQVVGRGVSGRGTDAHGLEAEAQARVLIHVRKEPPDRPPKDGTT